MRTDGETLLTIGAPEHDAAVYHLSGFLAPDPVICLRAAGKIYLGVSAMEYGRAKRDARVDEVLSYDELGVARLARELQSGDRGQAAAAAELLKSLGADGPVYVPPDTGVVYADELRARGVELAPNARLFSGMRRQKTEAEVAAIEQTQRAVEAACHHAVGVLRESEVSDDGTLTWRGETLTSETLRAEIDTDLLRQGCAAENTIAAGGAQAADPHERGHGPLRAGESIILDIFPVGRDNRYFADMTRTVIKGEPADGLRRMYDAVLAAQEAALGMIRAGINGRDVHSKVSEILHDAGYKTTQHDQEPGVPLQEGFMHGTGHGVGLEIHESPRVSLADEELLPGDVITIEPGVYDPEAGGVRIEDLVLVTDDGCRNLTDFPKQFVL
jgi:Xaa-Pro aminopeptidase